MSDLCNRCQIPQCDPAEPEYRPEWILNAVPGTESSLDNCQRYRNLSASAPPPGTCPAALFDQDALLPCDDYVYETTDTVVYDVSYHQTAYFIYIIRYFLYITD